MLSFANTNYTGTLDPGDDDDLAKEAEFQSLLDHRYKELSPSPEGRSVNGLMTGGDTPNDLLTADHDPEEESDCDEDIYKALDEFYVKMDRNGGGTKRENGKLRQKYADLDINDMGVRTAAADGPPLDDSSFSPSERDENLPFGWEKHEGLFSLQIFFLIPVMMCWSKGATDSRFTIWVCGVCGWIHTRIVKREFTASLL